MENFVCEPQYWSGIATLRTFLYGKFFSFFLRLYESVRSILSFFFIQLLSFFLREHFENFGRMKIGRPSWKVHWNSTRDSRPEWKLLILQFREREYKKKITIRFSKRCLNQRKHTSFYYETIIIRLIEFGFGETLPSGNISSRRRLNFCRNYILTNWRFYQY